jgi:uncharacterized protein YjbJ (UPF0337 family)
MKTSTQDHLSGSAKELKGKIKETTGKITHNPRLREEGRDEQAAGKVQKKVGDIEKVFDS